MKWQRLREAKSELGNLGETLTWEQLVNWATKLKPMIKEFFPNHLQDFEKLMNTPRWVDSPRYIKVRSEIDDMFEGFAIGRQPSYDNDYQNQEAEQKEKEANQQIIIERKNNFLSFIEGILGLHDVKKSEKTSVSTTKEPIEREITSNNIKSKKVRRTIDLTFIKIPDLRKYAYSLYEEHSKCLDNRCWRAAVTTAGSVLEAILHDRIYDNNPGINMEKWTLGKYIEKAISESLLDESILGKLPKGLLDHRNTIHPENYLRTKIQIDVNAAMILSSAVYSASKHFGGHSGVVDEFIEIFDFSSEQPAWPEHWPDSKPTVKWEEGVGLRIVAPNSAKGGGVNKDIQEIGEKGDNIIVRILVSSSNQTSNFQAWLTDVDHPASQGIVEAINFQPRWIDRKIKVTETEKIRIHLHCIKEASIIVHKIIVGTSI